MNVQLKYYLGLVLLRLLRQHGLTQKAICEQLGKKPGVVNAWFRGKSMPDSENLAQLAGVFGLTADALLDLARGEAAQAPAAPPAASSLTPLRERRADLPPAARAIVQELTDTPARAVWVLTLLELLEHGDESIQRATRQALNAFRHAAGLSEKDLPVLSGRPRKKRA